MNSSSVARLLIGAAVALPLGGGVMVAQSIVSAAQPAPDRSPADLWSAPSQRQLAGELNPHPFSCPLQRIGTQFVRCDHLTGAGVPAPAYIPEYLPPG